MSAGQPAPVLVHDLGGSGPVLVLGPSLGVGVRPLWERALPGLRSQHHVLAWELPGHDGAPAAEVDDLGDLAAAVLTAVTAASGGAGPFHYAGVSVGGAVGLELLRAPARVRSATLLCTGARIGAAGGWRQRAADVLQHGTGSLAAGAPERWFSAATRSGRPELVELAVSRLGAVDDAAYAALCRGLAALDLTGRLAEIDRPVLAVAGAEDPVTPPATLRHLAAGVQHGTVAVLDGVSHLAPLEAPDEVVRLVAEHVGDVEEHGTGAPDTLAAVRARGMRVRREVLGDEHVDRTLVARSPVTADFQDLITTVAWGSVWDRPGLGRRERSVATLTALVAGGHLEELAMHVPAALRNGLTRQEVVEVVLQAAVYCGVPAANSAFRVLSEVLERPGDEDPAT